VVFIMLSGPGPRAVGFDARAPLAHAMNLDTQLILYTSGGVKKGEYRLLDGGGTRSLTPHPEGRRLLVLTDRFLADVKLPPE
jgi:hypothetical protein